MSIRASDWIKQLHHAAVAAVKSTGHRPCIGTTCASVPNSPARWPYSSFFDWHSDPSDPGFLPPLYNPKRKIDVEFVGSSTAPFGLDSGGTKYTVNTNYIFVGLNPSRDLMSLGINPKDQNDGNWTNFNLASECTPGKRWRTYCKWTNIGALVHLLSTTSPGRYDLCKGAYMLDLYPLVTCSSAKSATKHVNATAHCRALNWKILKEEFDLYKTYIQSSGVLPEFFCFGAAAYEELWSFASGPGAGLFTNAKITPVFHYAQGNHEPCCGGLPGVDPAWS